MRTIDELGISPTPWESHKQFVIANDDGSVIAATNIRDARLIAAAPELYECLCEAIHQTCLYCKYKKCKECKVVNKWKDAIAKAGGEEVK